MNAEQGNERSCANRPEDRLGALERTLPDLRERLARIESLAEHGATRVGLGNAAADLRSEFAALQRHLNDMEISLIKWLAATVFGGVLLLLALDALR